jgi:spore germination protein GerM
MQAFRSQFLPKRLRGLIAGMALVAATAAITAGCADDASVAPTTTTAGGSTAQTTARPASSRTTVYFLDSSGERLTEVVTSDSADGETALAVALRTLAAGPQQAGLTTALPAGTRLISSSQDGGTARVNFSSEFASGYPSGGSAAEIAVLAPIVFTATEVPGVDSVLIEVEGAPPDIPTQFDLSAPLARDDFPPELVAAP